MTVPNETGSLETVEAWAKLGAKLIMWPEDAPCERPGEAKGPRGSGWKDQIWAPSDWREGIRVGVMTGHEVSPGRFLTDYDIDCAEVAGVIAALLPPTGAVFGRASKPVSHAMYTTPSAFPSMTFADVDKTKILEVRSAKADGTVGLQTMVPPSIWEKAGAREKLAWARTAGGLIVPAHLAEEGLAQRIGTLAAIAAVLARNFGRHGFGHEARLAWAGWALRLGIEPGDAIRMGEAISPFCENDEVGDVRVVVESTARALKAGRKATGGPGLARILGSRGAAVVTLMEGWLGKGEDFERGKHGGILPESQPNVRRAIALAEVELSWDKFADKVMASEGGSAPAVADDDLIGRLRLRIDREHRFRPSKELFWDVARDLAFERPFHPVVDWLASLTWDGTPRVGTWLVDFAGAEDCEYVREVSTLFLVAAVRRVREPGCLYHEMMVLEGPQGVEKSSLLAALVPRREWFSDDLPLNVDAKQTIERTAGKWIIEASELSGIGKADVEHLKGWMSRKSDGPARLAYGRMSVERDRQFVNAGTTNNRKYLNDATGARRFWPIAVGRIRLAELLAARDQLWAEAGALEKEGRSIRLDRRLWAEAAMHQEARREEDAWEDEIARRVAAEPRKKDGRKKIAGRDLWLAVGVQMDRRDRRGGVRISEIMQRLGFRPQKVRDETGETVAGYAEIEQRFELSETEVVE